MAKMEPPCSLTTGLVAGKGQYLINKHGDKPLVIRFESRDGDWITGFDRGQKHTVLAADYERFELRR